MATPLYTDGPFGAPSGGIFQQPGSGSPGLGVAPAPSSAPAAAAPASLPTITPQDLIRARIAQMSPGQKVLSALGEFGNAVLGRPSPLRKQAELQMQDRLTKQKELASSVSALQGGLKLLDGMQPGEERSKFVDSYAAQLDGTTPGLGDTFKAMSKRPDLAALLQHYTSDLPPAMRIMAATNPQGFVKYIGTPDGQKALQGAMDQRALHAITRKGQIIYANWQQLVPQAMVDKFNKDGRITASEFLQANDIIRQTHPELALNDPELAVITRNPNAFFTPLGIVTPKNEQSVLEAAAKKANAPGAPTLKNGYVNGRLTTLEAKDGKWVEFGHKAEQPGAAAWDKVREKVANLQMKILSGEQLSKQERAFLDEYERTNPINAAMRQALSGGPAGAPDLAHPGVARPTTQAEFDALPSGAPYINPADGKQYTKK